MLELYSRSRVLGKRRESVIKAQHLRRINHRYTFLPAEKKLMAFSLYERVVGNTMQMIARV